MTVIVVNGIAREVAADPDTPLLWVLREDLELAGTKFGCGIGMCGACTVHVDGEAVRSCQVPLAAVGESRIATIEALAPAGAELHPVQQAWIEQQVPQCGYCQPGMIMAVAALLKQNPNPSEQAIREGVTNICRCGTYARVVDAVRKAVALST